MKTVWKIAIIYCLSVMSQSAYAYNWLTCGGGATVMNFNNGHMTYNFGDNLSAEEKNAINLAHGRATAFSDSSISIANNNDNSYGRNNGENEIYIDNDTNTAYCSFAVDASCNVLESDMVYSVSTTWTTVDDSTHFPYQNFGGVFERSMTGTAVHEGGHCIGMAHSNNAYNMMGSDFSHVTRNGTTAFYGPGEDMSDGLIDLHGKRSGTDAFRDVGVTVMRYDGISNVQYSRHDFGLLRDSGGTELPQVGSYVGQVMYQIQPGQAIQMELTFEANGEQDIEDPNVAYYLSTNSIISQSDILVHTHSGSMSRGLPWERTISFTLPATIAPGNYFLGAFVDYDNLISEQTGANNQAYYPVNVPVPPQITVTSPNGGETWVANTTETVTWTEQSLPATDNLYVFLCDNAGTSCSQLTGAISLGVQSASVTVPDISTTQAVIFVGSWTGSEYTVTDESDAEFSVVPACVGCGCAP